MSTLARLLKESWSLVEDRADHLANHFYARLFLIDPNLRDMFPVQMAVQRSRLLGALVEPVQTVPNPSQVVPCFLSLALAQPTIRLLPGQFEAGRSAPIDP